MTTGERPPEDRALAMLVALLACLDDLREAVGADWDDVRERLRAQVEAWLRSDDELYTLMTNVRVTLRRYPEARDTLDEALRARRSTPELAFALKGVTRGTTRSPFESLNPSRGSEEPVPRAQVESLVDSLRDLLVDPAALHLNAWFPEHRGERPLTVGKAARLCVNLGPRRDEGASVGAAHSARLYEVDHVDVVVRCAGATVTPGSRRLDLPPRADRAVEFALTPRCEGPLRVVVVILIQGDPVERLEFGAHARAGMTS